jgi:hypothetical protein
VHVVDNAGNWNDEKNSNRNGQPSGFEPVEVEVLKTEPTEPIAVEETFGSANPDLALKGDIYYLDEGTPSLPDFAGLTPIGTIYADVLDIPSRSFKSGFPGVTERFEWFAIRYTGAFEISLEGEYAFRLLSDDGSRLIIDGDLIIDNDGQHSPKSVSGAVYLNPSQHSIEVDYFQGPRDAIALQLFWTPPGVSESIFDGKGLKQLDDTTPTVQSFQVAPHGLAVGDSFSIDYTVSDSSGSGLKQVELWRKDETSDWQQINTNTLTGDTGPLSGSFSDSPVAPGKYWYGVHVVDNAGNWNDESNSNTNGQPSGFEPMEVEVKEPETAKASSQAPLEEWNKTFGGASDDGVGAGAYPMQPTADGGYILAGSTNSYGAGGGDTWLIKTDAEGSKIWEKNFGGANDDWANSVQQTIDGGYILAGGTQSFGAGGMDFWLIKTDAEGNKLWDRTFGGWSNEIANSVQQTSDGGYILAGAGSGDAWLIKTDSDGNKIWDKTFGGSNDDWAHLVQLTSDGGYILGGRKEAHGSASGDAWIVKTDAEGSELWERTFGGSDKDMINSVQPTSDGGYILAGGTSSYGAGGYDLWMIKTDAEGNRLWDKTFGGASLDGALSVQSTRDNGYILVGSTESYGAGSGDAWLIKTDAEGNELWNKTFGGVNWDGAWAGQPNDDGSYILAGSTNSHGAGGSDAWLIKVAPA